VPPPPASAPLVDIRASLIPDVPVPGLPAVSLFSGAAGGPALQPSMPEITVSEAPLGRASLAAIRHEVASAPAITVTEGALGRESMVAIRRDVASGGSVPDIVVGEAPLGRESMVAIRRDVAAGGSAPEISVTEVAAGRATLAAIEMDNLPRPPSSPEAIRVELVSMPEVDVSEGGRATLPWVEMPADTKRAADAAGVGRKLAAPKISLKLEEGDEEGGRGR
jgi:hypothetical protein